MANTWTKGYTNGNPPTEANLDSLASTMKIDITNLDFSTSNSQADYIITSNGDGVPPSYKSPNTVAATIGSSGANSVLGKATTFNASIANLVLSPTTYTQTGSGTTTTLSASVNLTQLTIASGASGVYLVYGNASVSVLDSRVGTNNIFVNNTSYIDLNGGILGGFGRGKSSIALTATSTGVSFTQLGYTDNLSFQFLQTLSAADILTLVAGAVSNPPISTGSAFGELSIWRLYQA